MVGMGVGKKVEGRDGCETWRSAKLVHADREGRDEPMKGCSSRHQLMRTWPGPDRPVAHVILGVPETHKIETQPFARISLTLTWLNRL